MSHDLHCGSSSRSLATNSRKLAQELRKKYGDIYEIYLGSTRTIWLNRADMVDEIMLSNNRLAENFNLDELGVSDKGILANRNLDDVMYHRKIYAKTILTPQFNKSIIPITQSLFKELESLWKDYGCLEGDKEIDIFLWMERLGFECMLKLFTNFRTYALINYYNFLNPKQKITIPENPLSPIVTEGFLKNLHDYFSILHHFFFSVKCLLRAPGKRKITNNYLRGKDLLDSNIMNIIKLRKSQIENSSIDELRKNQDLLTQLITMNTEKDITKGITDKFHSEPMSDVNIRQNLLEIMASGISASSSFLCYMIYTVAHHPKVLQQIQEELTNVLGTKEDSEITFEDLNKLKYCKAVISEVGRFRTSVNTRVSLKPVVIDNYKLPANQQFIINVPAIHMDPKNWNNPEEFDPSRFLSSDGDSKNTLMMFGVGSRTCKYLFLHTNKIKIDLKLTFI
ncbi:6680_t:CDS:2 [Diversispora eburnea]|uniref:6680_t:CDS:1 n=1 Tax=Diversispora eburnea TaxID=1213867 RepID=A0A9N8YPT2_9GLOM|nr:6680_t:CDS:2 [Diversispora eburnea]